MIRSSMRPRARSASGGRLSTDRRASRANVRMASRWRPAREGNSGGEREVGVIVVGVDHSEGAKEALRFAFEEAQLRQATLRAVHAWQFGYIGAPGIEGSVPVLGAELERASRRRRSRPRRDRSGGDSRRGRRNDRASRRRGAAAAVSGRGVARC